MCFRLQPFNAQGHEEFQEQLPGALEGETGSPNVSATGEAADRGWNASIGPMEAGDSVSYCNGRHGLREFAYLRSRASFRGLQFTIDTSSLLPTIEGVQISRK